MEMFEWQGPDIEEQFTICIFAINFESKKFSLQAKFVRIFNDYGRLSFCLSFSLECFPAVFIILVDYHFAVSKFRAPSARLSFCPKNFPQFLETFVLFFQTSKVEIKSKFLAILQWNVEPRFCSMQTLTVHSQFHSHSPNSASSSALSPSSSITLNMHFSSVFFKIEHTQTKQLRYSPSTRVVGKWSPNIICFFSEKGA